MPSFTCRSFSVETLKIFICIVLIKKSQESRNSKTDLMQ